MDELIKEVVLTCRALREWLAAHPQLPLAAKAVEPAAAVEVTSAQRRRKAKETAIPAATPVLAGPEGMFGPETQAPAPAPAAKTNAEQFAEAAAKCQELVGAFIRRKNHSTPNTGLAAARAIVTEVAPACVGKKIEEWPHDARLKIIARLEQEMEAAGA